MSAPERLRALIVDDEPLAREGLRGDLLAVADGVGGPLDVVAECGDGIAAREALLRLRPDVIFLDIEMPEVDSFALLESLAPEDVPPAVVFVTAYDAHALRAFEARALDYLLKPVEPERLRVAVERAARRVREARALRDALDAGTAPDDGDAPPAAACWATQLLVPDRGRMLVVPVDELEWIEGETYYVRLHPTPPGARSRLLRERMHVLVSRLDPARFFRTHRSAIVRLDRVRAIENVSRYEHVVVLASGARAPLSRERRARLEERIRGL